MDTISAGRLRVRSIDLLRGLVMVIMALDHTRDFFHAAAMTQDPLNPETTTPALYFTRWITHFCAPAFSFLAGTSAYFQSIRKSKKELSLFLIKRGIWLMVIDVFVFNFAFSFDIHYSSIGLATLWSLGVSMVFLGLAVWLPLQAILAIGLIIVFGHNLLNIYEQDQKDISIWYALLHRVNLFKLGSHNVLVLYPYLSWVGLMFMGYCSGRLFYDVDVARRRKILMWLGIAVTLFFLVLRYANVYGDAGRWKEESSFLKTVFSFFNTQKYPPSLLFMCMTIGPSLIFLSIYDQAKGKLVDIISVYGRVPFFYFLAHFFLLHIICMIMFLLRGHSFAEGLQNRLLVPFFVNPGEGYGLPVVYIIWIAVVIFMFPICRWYDRYKQAHKGNKWLSYL